MSIRLRTATIVASTMLVLTVALLVAAGVLITRAFNELERRDVRQSVRLATNWLADEGPPLAATAVSYGSWNDTYRFIQDHDRAYVRANLDDSMVAGLSVDFMVFLDRRGRVVQAASIDQATVHSRPLPVGLTDWLARRPAVLHMEDPKAMTSGLVGLPAGVAVVGAAPITDNRSEAPVRGTVLIGYLLRPEDHRVLDGGSLTWSSLGDSDAPADVLTAAVHTTGGRTFVHAIDGDTVGGYAMVAGFGGSSPVLVRVLKARTIAAEGRTVLTLAILGLILFVVLSVVALLVAVDRSILARLASLSAQVKRIGDTESTGLRLKVAGDDEIGELTGGINDMLEALDQSRDTLVELATHDSLTGLGNRRWFEDELVRQLAEYDRHRAGGALLWFDLDEFKAVNDRYGHKAGDEALSAFADVLREETRRSSALARLGGDEFAVIIRGANEGEAMQAAERLIELLRSQCPVLDGHHIRLSASAGVALYPDDGLTIDALLTAADRAMYEAKAEGRGRARRAAGRSSTPSRVAPAAVPTAD